ncbi:MAG: transcription-repair coupling factor [Termitinemataceae bacterium]|nr:MAG: transcription-repair coupling factor [Termitinemataceae bacterium]
MIDFNSIVKGITDSTLFEPLLEAYKGNKFPLSINGVHGSLHAIVAGALHNVNDAPALIVVPAESDALELQSDLSFLQIESMIFPSWGTLPYRSLAPFSAVFADRAKVLAALCGEKRCPVIIAAMRSFLTPVPPPDYFKKLSIKISVGGTIDTVELSRILTSWGWTKVQRVQMPAEFVVHGEVMDIFAGGSDAYRILLDFDKVESIKLFDINDQSTVSAVDKIAIHPQKELVWDDERIDILSENLAALPEFKDDGKTLLENLMTEKIVSGEELLYPLAFEKLKQTKQGFSILDYFECFKNSDVIFFDYERLEKIQEVLDKEYLNLFRSTLREREVPPPSAILLDFKECKGRVQRGIYFLSFSSEQSIDLQSSSAKNYMGNITYMKEDFFALLEQGWMIVVASQSESQVLRISEMLHSPEEASTHQLYVINMPLSQGFALSELKFLLVQEKEIFGRQRRPQSLKTVKSKALDTFVELNPGDYVVHVNYGIGLFKGIDRITALGHERDYIKLEYANEETVFIPIEQVNLVQRYICNEGAAPRLDSLGSKAWSERKERARKAAEELAEKLLDIYAKRSAAIGFTFPPDTEWQTMFEASFPYEETEDQLRCVEEIKTDMESTRPMDRLVCGDVGYGKTEVALRACFKAIMGGKQTAFMVPTTILAEQHYETFVERFRNFPVRVAMLSRFVDRKTINKNLEAVEKGEVDILIGTHRIIQKDVHFKDLGLMVIDEEQRFGVKDKERLKEMKRNVDCLALSATPIPRTLHMSLIKIRDMSILATPPQNRRPIETSVSEYDDAIVISAIRQEIERGGQVFFLHNKIQTLEEVRLRLQRLMPELIVDIAHGKMDVRQLEDVMHHFISGGFHVLVSTTIIENGIDIPNVNTIIIDRADMYGVSQLYQLRGRVGRSDRTAYAYLLYPSDTAISELAMKRLQAISDFTELGSGFKIAMKDMEIRGAGNLLGREQSGAIYSVGFDLYMRLLDEAIQKLQKEDYTAETETLLELEYSGFIPDNYIASAQEKMDLYKKIAAVTNKDELESLQQTIIDRFGPPPQEAISLLSLAEIRIVCKELSILSLKERKGIVQMQFTKVSKINVDKIIRLIKESAGKIKIDPSSPDTLILQTGNIGLKEKSEYIRQKLEALR